MALSPLGNVVFWVKLKCLCGKRAVVNELRLPAAPALAAVVLLGRWSVAIFLRETVAGPREWAWGTEVELGEGPRNP
uniref:Zinc finger FYVE-type containing 19 n=1 Tax=Molossus molossus TaxID=27622 RepID=A0A7J8K411_MOLMO|nr:zinc finger FYVE-type containing 19 [Molossus molossus]